MTECVAITARNASVLLRRHALATVKSDETDAGPQKWKCAGPVKYGTSNYSFCYMLCTSVAAGDGFLGSASDHKARMVLCHCRHSEGN